MARFTREERGLVRWLAALPNERDRLLLELHYAEGLSPAEIAKVLGKRHGPPPKRRQAAGAPISSPAIVQSAAAAHGAAKRLDPALRVQARLAGLRWMAGLELTRLEAEAECRPTRRVTRRV